MTNIFSGLLRTRERMATATGEDWNQWRDRLIIGDVGVATAQSLVDEVRQTVGKESPSADIFVDAINRRLRRVEALLATEGHRPCVILVMGVNGSGKTTTVAKLSHLLLRKNKTVMLAAGDTFRAAARAQLEKWATQLGGLEIVGGGGDPAAVAYQAVTAGIAKKSDIVIIDTAGRLSTQPHLMAELAKIRRAVNKALPGAPHELLLVLDATIGQNALSQIAAFRETVGVTGLVITKLDGSSKGGFLIPIAERYAIPIRYVGVGEKNDDLAIFKADEYAAALIGAGR